MDSFENDFEDNLELARAMLAGGDDHGDLWEANDLVNRALALRPGDPDAWILKCQILSALDDDFAALAAVEMVIRRRPRMAEAHYWRAAILSDLERLDEALIAVERAFGFLVPADEWMVEDLYHEKACVLRGLGRGDDARTTLETGLVRCPGSKILAEGLAPLERERVRATFKVIPGGIR